MPVRMEELHARAPTPRPARRPWLVGNNFRMNLNGTLRAPSLPPLLFTPTIRQSPHSCISLSYSIAALPNAVSLPLNLFLFFRFFRSSFPRTFLVVYTTAPYAIPTRISPPSLGFLRRQWCSTGAEHESRHPRHLSPSGHVLDRSGGEYWFIRRRSNPFHTARSFSPPPLYNTYTEIYWIVCVLIHVYIIYE